MCECTVTIIPLIHILKWTISIHEIHTDPYLRVEGEREGRGKGCEGWLKRHGVGRRWRWLESKHGQWSDSAVPHSILGYPYSNTDPQSYP